MDEAADPLEDTDLSRRPWTQEVSARSGSTPPALPPL